MNQRSAEFKSAYVAQGRAMLAGEGLAANARGTGSSASADVTDVCAPALVLGRRLDDYTLHV